MNGYLLNLTTPTSATKQMNKLKLLSPLLLTPFLLMGCSGTYNNIEADEAMPQLIDEGSTDEFN